MENQFHSVETWQGHVLVSASLLPPSVEEKERIYPDRSTYTRSSPQLPLMKRRHGLHMAASLPPVPDYWNHEHRGQVEPVVDATCGSHLWLTPPMMNVIPSSTNFPEPCSPVYPPPVHSDPMSAAEDRSSISSCWTPNSHDSDCTPPTDWDDGMTVTSSASASTPSPDGYFGQQQQALFFTAAFHFQPSLSPEDEQPPKRRRLSPEMPPIHNLYDSDGNLWF